MKQRIFLSIIFLFIYTLTVSSQVFTGTTGTAQRHVKVHYDQIRAYDAAHPSDSIPKLKKPKPHFYPPVYPIDPSEIIYREPPRDEEPSSVQRESSPEPYLNFPGLGDNQAAIPPDTKGSVGLNHLMITLNTEVRIQDKEGNNLSTISLSSFWSSLPGANGTFDPQLMYDPYEDRWIFVVVKDSNPVSSEIFLAVSATGDPMGEWYLYAFDSDPANTTWCDFPSVGFNKKWVVVSGNMFTSNNSFMNAAVWVINKDDLYDGIPNAAFTRLVPSNGFTIAPAMTYDDELEDIYCVTNVSGNSAGDGYIRKYRITTGPLGNAIIESQGLISSPDPWADTYPQNNGNISPQLGSSQRIDAGDSRIRNTMYKNGSLWFTQTIFLPANNPSRCSVQWWQLSETGTIIQRGRVDDPSGTMFYSYSSLSVNGINDVLVGYSSFSSSQYASANYSFRTADDPLNTLRDPYLFKSGEAPYFKTYGGDRNRWGDYSATYVDPANDLNFWTLQEYAVSPSNIWGTWWAMVKKEAAPIPQFSANMTTVPVTTGVNFTDKSQFVPTSWLWTFEGGTPATSTEQNPSNIIYNAPGVYDVTLTVSNETGSNTVTVEDYITASTTILPDVDFMVEETVICIGDTVNITDLTTYNPTGWTWNISPDHFLYVNGTTSASQHPQIVITAPGIFSVALTASNPNGSSTLTKENYLAAGGTTLPFEEDFEGSFNSRGWTIDNPDNDITWDITNIDGTEPGYKAAYMDIRSYNAIRERDRLISSPLDFSGFEYITMTFRYAYAQYNPNITDSLIVYISDDCQQTWSRLIALGEDGSGNFFTHTSMTSEFSPQNEDDWCGAPNGPACPYLDLSPWAGKTDVRIMFECYSFYGNNLYLDNIVIYNSVGIPRKTKEADISIFPNPATGMVNVYFEETRGRAHLRIINLQGQTIVGRIIQPGSGSVQMDLSESPRGIYLVEFISQDAVIVKKLMLE
ncbi:MAG: PKD domain-containing protein [Bacteroidales bacterium]|nr:PKD domain-containing protein [Bacteroidales bacterium]